MSVIDRLERAVYVRRRPDGTDRRRLILEPTPPRRPAILRYSGVPSRPPRSSSRRIRSRTWQ